MTEFRAGDRVLVEAIVEHANKSGVLIRIGNHRAIRIEPETLTMEHPYFHPGDSVWDEEGMPLKVLAVHGEAVWVINPDNEALTLRAFELNREFRPDLRMTEKELADGIDALTPPPRDRPAPPELVDRAPARNDEEIPF